MWFPLWLSISPETITIDLVSTLDSAIIVTIGLALIKYSYWSSGVEDGPLDALVPGFVRTIGSVRDFRGAVSFLFGRSLENVFVL